MLKRMHEFLSGAPKSRGKHLSVCFHVKQMLKGFASLGAVVADGTLLCSALHVTPQQPDGGMLCSGKLGHQPPTAFPALKPNLVVVSAHSCFIILSKISSEMFPPGLMLLTFVL